MIKKRLKIFTIIIVGILFLFLLAFFGFNFWLRYKFPDYIKNKTPYQISYKSLNVEILSGNIYATEIFIKSKNPFDKKVLGIDGKIKNLFVGRLGLIDLIKNKQINTNSLKLENPELIIHLPESKNKASAKNQNTISFKNLDITNGNVAIFKPDQIQFFSAKNLQISIKNLELNQNNEDTGLPFGFDEYSLAAEYFFIAPDQNYSITADNITTQNGQMNVKNFALLPLQEFDVWKKNNPNTKSQFSLKIPNIDFREIQLQKNILKLTSINIENPLLIIRNQKRKTTEKKKNKSGFMFDFQDIILNNGQLTTLDENGSKVFDIKNLKANINGLKKDEESSKQKIPFTYKDYSLSGTDLYYDAGKFYSLTLASFDIKTSAADFRNFTMKPKLSRAEFVKSIPMEKDLFDIKANQIKLSGLDWKFVNEQPDIRLKNAVLTNVDANIFRSKIPKDDPKEKLLYSKLLRTIKFPMKVENLSLLDSKLVYEEDKPDNNGPGKVIFTDFNMNVKNLNSNKKKGENTKVPININCRFFDSSAMTVRWNFDTADLHDNFTIAGNISELPAEKITPFVKPYMNITATGMFTRLDFDFKGNNDIMNGTFRIKNKDLKVNILDKNTKEKKKLLSAVVNLAVKSNSKQFPESVDIHIERNKQRSFFNEFWKGIEDGLKKTLLIIKID